MMRAPNKLTWLGLPVAALAALLLVYLQGMNHGLFLFFNHWQRSIPGVYWAYLTTFGDAAVVMAMMMVFAGRRPDILWAAMLALVIGAVVTYGLKDALDATRPPGIFPADQIMVYGLRAVSNSFPSGHTLTAWTLTSILWMGLRRPWPYGLVLLAIMVGISRMVIGVHWPVDVLGGMGLGWLVGQASVFLSRRIPSGMRPWPQRFFVLILMADCIGLFWYDNGYPQTLWMQKTIAVAVLLAMVPVLKQVFGAGTPGSYDK